MYLPQRWAWHVLNHKKKVIFFSLLGGLAFYYDIHSKFYSALVRQTLQQRIERRVLSHKHIPSHTACKEPVSSFSPEVHREIVEFFLEEDGQMMFGVPRVVLVEVFKDWYKDEKAVRKFYYNSGYRKTVSPTQKEQERASLSLQEFLKFLEPLRDQSLEEPQILEILHGPLRTKLREVRAPIGRRAAETEACKAYCETDRGNQEDEQQTG